MTVEQIAQICHEANRAYCQIIGDNSQVGWDEAEEWQRDSAISGVKSFLENSDATPEFMHDKWVNDKEVNGWVWGEIKDAEKKTHPCILPYSQLPEDQRKKDDLFLAIVKCFKENEE